jgi:hypothetical protein
MLDLSENWKRVVDTLYSGVIVIDTNGAIWSQPDTRLSDGFSHY